MFSLSCPNLFISFLPGLSMNTKKKQVMIFKLFFFTLFWTLSLTHTLIIDWTQFHIVEGYKSTCHYTKQLVTSTLNSRPFVKIQDFSWFHSIKQYTDGPSDQLYGSTWAENNCSYSRVLNHLTFLCYLTFNFIFTFILKL